jgi:hypothetical protein
MNYIIKATCLIKSLCIFFIMLFSFSVFAADIPADTLGGQKYDKLKCINEMTQNCIDTVCINSDQINCHDSCSKMSEQKCRQQANE